ncbi:MAG TPA: DUF1993 family protein [Casimicrobiaceae bacterium]|nr:DUF1993 family protein [Casimicrobiaceae bacterium]
MAAVSGVATPWATVYVKRRRAEIGALHACRQLTTTAYATLRHNGVEIGKADFIGVLD